MREMHQGIPMGSTPVTGPGASALKYDIVTALLVMAARGETTEARLALRLSLLITARYNWRQGQFTVGQREMARMWGVTERTAKRELASMRHRGWITVSRPAARGRVASYRLELPVVLRSTVPHWDAVGPDFSARMSGASEQPEPTSNVVPLTKKSSALPVEDDFGWHRAAQRLRDQDPSVYEAWFAGLRPLEAEGGHLTFSAPSHFVADYVRTHFLTRMLAAVTAECRDIREVGIVCETR